MSSAGHIKPRKNQKGEITGYQLVVEIEPDPITGKRRRFYRTVKGNKKQVAKALRDFQAEIENGGVPTAHSVMKVKDWMDQWLKLYLPNIEETTRVGYREKIDKYINPNLGNIPLKSLTTTAVQAWVNKLQTEYGLAPKTISNAYLNLSAAMKQAVMEGKIPTNPCLYVKLPKKQKYQAAYYTKAEVTDVLNKVKGTDLYLPILIEFYLGLRRGELLGLHWSDIDMENGIAHIRNNYVRGEKGAICKTPKSQAGIRDLPIGASLLPELKKARAQYNMNKLAMGTAFTDSDLVICKPDGTPYKPDTMSHKWERFLKKHSLKKIRFHDLRHTCATMLIEANVPMKTVSTFMGHANIQITFDTYAHCTKTMEQQAADTIDNILSHVI